MKQPTPKGERLAYRDSVATGWHMCLRHTWPRDQEADRQQAISECNEEIIADEG